MKGGDAIKRLTNKFRYLIKFEKQYEKTSVCRIEAIIGKPLLICGLVCTKIHKNYGASQLSITLTRSSCQ